MSDFNGQMDVYNGPYSNRTFQNIDNTISGKSVVLENDFSSENSNISKQDMWPYSLNDYLKFFVGKAVQIEYVLPNGRCCIKRGELNVAGLNFIGIRMLQTNNLLLIDLNAIESICIINFEGNNSKHRY